MGTLTPEERNAIAVQALRDQLDAVRREQAIFEAATALMRKQRRRALALATGLLVLHGLALLTLLAGLVGIIGAYVMEGERAALAPWVFCLLGGVGAAEVFHWAGKACLARADRIGIQWKKRFDLE